jgi:hypothetical protein
MISWIRRSIRGTQVRNELHFNHVILVKAEDHVEALGKVRSFMEAYYPSVYDWYQIGGRWAWSDLFDKYHDKIYRPQTDEDKERGMLVYWNQYHDEEVKGKTWRCEFPNGEVKEFNYGDSYGLKSWIDQHPEYSEVIDANHPRFMDRLFHMSSMSVNVEPHIQDEIKKHWNKDTLWEAFLNPINFRVAVEREYMALYYLKKILGQADTHEYTTDSYFYNIEEYSKSFDLEEIQADPEHWFLVNLDLHN